MFRTTPGPLGSDARNVRDFQFSSPGYTIKGAMKIPFRMQRRFLAAALCLAVACLFAASSLYAQATRAQTTILTPSQVAKIVPATVFFRGQSATVQIRNTYGLRFPDGALMLAGLVDTSGYSSGVKTKYQGYLLTESPLTINGKPLLAGAYGFGFLTNNEFVVMDIGAHDVLRAPSHTDTAMRRPRPLMVRPGTHTGTFRLYEGRSFVSVRLK